MIMYKVKYLTHKNIVATVYLHADSQEEAEEHANHIKGAVRIISVKEATV